MDGACAVSKLELRVAVAATIIPSSGAGGQDAKRCRVNDLVGCATRVVVWSLVDALLLYVVHPCLQLSLPPPPPAPSVATRPKNRSLAPKVPSYPYPEPLTCPSETT